MPENDAPHGEETIIEPPCEQLTDDPRNWFNTLERPPVREVVYNAIDGERRYQHARWGPGFHTPTEFILYMEEYLVKARTLVTSGASGGLQAMHAIRKVTALGVAALEQHGAPRR